MVQYPPLALSFTRSHRHICATPHFATYRTIYPIKKKKRKSFVTLSLQASRDMKIIVAGPQPQQSEHVENFSKDLCSNCIQAEFPRHVLVRLIFDAVNNRLRGSQTRVKEHCHVAGSYMRGAIAIPGKRTKAKCCGQTWPACLASRPSPHPV